MSDPLGFNKKLSRKQQRRVTKLTGEEINQIKLEARAEAIGFTVKVFEKVMKEEFGFGKVRMGRIAEGIYRELGYNPEE